MQGEVCFVIAWKEKEIYNPHSLRNHLTPSFWRIWTTQQTIIVSHVTHWWGMDLVSRKSPAVSNSLAWGHNFFVYGGVVSATTPPTLKLGIKECNVLKENNVNDPFLLNISLLRFAVFSYPPGGCTGKGLYVVLGTSRCDWHLFLWVTLYAL